MLDVPAVPLRQIFKHSRNTSELANLTKVLVYQLVVSSPHQPCLI